MSFWVLLLFELSQFEFSVVSQYELCFVTNWVFEFCHNLSFRVFSKFGFGHNLSFWIVICSVWVLSQLDISELSKFEFLNCSNSNYWNVAIWVCIFLLANNFFCVKKKWKKENHFRFFFVKTFLENKLQRNLVWKQLLGETVFWYFCFVGKQFFCQSKFCDKCSFFCENSSWIKKICN